MAGRPPSLNRVAVSSGRGPDTARTDGSLEVLVSEGFAQARGLKPGAELRALVNGRQRTLRVVGTALSPEFIFAGLEGVFGQQFNKLAEWTALMRTDPKDVALLKSQSAQQLAALKEISAAIKKK